MTPSLNKCPRCGTLRPSGEVAHTCVVRNPADTGTSREGDPYAEIAALTERLRAVEAERDEWKRKYETQCAGSMSAHERRIHLEADLSALREDLARKDAALKELCKDEPLVEPEWIESDNHGDIRSNASDITRWHLAKIARAALRTKEPPCRA